MTTLAERLGYDADARLLILNCDDLGMYRGVNAGIIEAITEGVATTCSLMAPCPAASHAIELLRRHPEIPFGVHLTLVSDLPEYRWGPLAPREAVPSLIGPDGNFLGLSQIDDLLAQARLEEVELEFRAQIGAVLAANLEPTHLDWHCLYDGGRDDIYELAVALASEHGLAVRASEAKVQQRMKARGLPTNDHPLLDSFGLDVEGKSARYAQLLRDLPRGLSQWAVHPTLADDESQAIDPGGWRIRASDYEFLVSREAREILAEEEITLLDYTSLQEIWRRMLGSPSPG